MTQVSKPISLELTDDELGAVSGGDSAMESVKAESQIQQTLSSMVNDVIKNFGGALQSAARAG
jgi:hypothetical protein